jgi:DNA-binding NtrC family response regulator
MPVDLPQEATQPAILVIDDDQAMLNSVGRMLRTEGFGDPLLCGDPRDAESLLESHTVGAILLDLTMPQLSGEVLLGRLREAYPEIPVIVVTATDDVDTAVTCVQAGAFDYLVKPVNFSRLLTTISRALQQRELRVENSRLRKMVAEPALSQPESFDDMITRSPAMLAMFRYIEAIGPSSEPVLVVGETGVGKELIAQAIHRVSARAGDLIAVNVAGIDENAFADTLFGHVKGAFTGAEQDREGMIERAGDGTLFLDEIGDLGMEMQTKLLRLLEEREYLPLGSDRSRRSRCRIVAATNRNLRGGIAEGRFREDLYYRLHTHLIRVPPLKERMGDLPLLVTHFLKEAATALGKPLPTPPRELTVHLMTYGFPGNVRELRAMVFDAVARHQGHVLSLASFHAYMDERAAGGALQEQTGEPLFSVEELPTVQAATRLLIAKALERTDGNQGAAARLLGISRRTVSRYVSGSCEARE